MLAYPQLSTGAAGQFPITRRRTRRTIVNRAADGRTVKLADPIGGQTEWALEYAGLNDAEAESLRHFFELTEGSLQTFTFLDPTANLLAWSDQLDEDVWIPGPLLVVSAGVTDPRGGTKAWQLNNPAGGAQSVMQTLQVPGGYTYCLSVYGRAESEVVATVLLDASRLARKLTSDWTRISIAGTGTAGAESVDFGIEIPDGAAIEIFGMQVEAQPAASPYHSSTSGGVYPDARFRNDVLAITVVSPGQHACTVNIIHADHL